MQLNDMSMILHRMKQTIIYWKIESKLLLSLPKFPIMQSLKFCGSSGFTSFLPSMNQNYLVHIFSQSGHSSARILSRNLRRFSQLDFM